MKENKDNSKDNYTLANRELKKENTKNKTGKTKNIIIKSIKKQMIVIILVVFIIIIIASVLNVINFKTVETISNISKAISDTGKIGDSDFLKINDNEGYYEIDIDKAYDELKAWAKKNNINLDDMGLTKEIYGLMLKMEAEQTLVSLGGTPMGDNAIQGKIVLNRKKADGTIVPMKFIKKSEWDQNIIKKKSNEIAGVGIGGTEAKETDDMTTDESKRIWMALKTSGWSNFAIAGAIGNIYVESKYSSTKVEGKNEQESTEYTIEIDKNDKEKVKNEFINDKKGYGLLQWNNKEDKKAIYDISKKNNNSIGDYSMQLKYIQNMAENNKKMQEYIKGKNTEGRDITEINYAVTAFYEYWIKNNYDFDNKNTSDTERKEDDLANRWAAGKAAYEEYVENLRLGSIISSNKIASSNKFVGIGKNNIKIADAVTRSEDSGTLTATSKEGVADLDKLWDETQSTFTLDDEKNVVVGSVYISEIQIEPNGFAEEESYVNKIVTEDGTLIQLDDGTEMKNDSNLCYQMQLKQQTISTEELPSSANLSSGAIASIMAATPGDKTTSKIQNKFKELIQSARDQQGKEIDIEDFTTVVVTTKTETMNLKFDIRKTVEFHPDNAVEENETKKSEFKGEQEKDFSDEDGYRKIITTEVTKIPQAVLSKQKTIGSEVTYHYEENTSEEIEQPEDVIVGDDEEYTGWVVCNKGGDGEQQNSKVQEDYHKFLEGLKSDVGGTVIDTHEHLTQTASKRTIKTQIDTTKSIYAKIGTSIVTNSANALVAYINEADPDEESLMEYLNNAGKVKAEEKDEIVDALLKAKKKSKSDSNSTNNGGGGGAPSNYPPNQGGGGNPNPSDDSDSTSGSDEKVNIDWELTNKLAKAAYKYVKKGLKYAENGSDLNTGVNNPQFVYQLLKTETKMYTGNYVSLKDYKTKLEDYLMSNNIKDAQEGDVIVYKSNSGDGYKVCVYAGRDNVIMEVAKSTNAVAKKLDLSKYVIDGIYRFNEDGSKPEVDPNIPRIILVEPVEISLEPDQKYQLKATIYPRTANKYTKLTWSSNHPSQVSVNQNGEIQAKGTGETIITVSTENGKKATCVVKLCAIIDMPRITASSGYNKKYFDKLIVPSKYVCSSTNVQPMWYIAILESKFSGTSEDGSHVTISSGTKILVVNQGLRHSNTECVCVIQTGSDKGKVVKIKISKLNLIQQLTNSNIKYTPETAMDFINSNNIGSSTNYLIWVNKYTQRAYLFKGSKNNWQLLKWPYGKNSKGHNSCKVGTGSYQYGRGCDYRQYKYKYQLYVKNHGFQGLPYYIHYTSKGGSGIHGCGGPGHPASHGCIRFDTDLAGWIYNNLPLKTRVVLY